ncbi:MAG: carboxypeptidase-like regulatory domain-containing protein [Thermodesulfobacteriota bacterium]|nr:carboxypeptidase-like regulatory domain-containing protein [Thermodesulfobacteriota bacterium]
MMYRKRMVLIATLAFLLPSPLFAHGVKGTVKEGGLVVTAQYDTGEPMSYARVKISAPETKLTFQSGRTDRNGRFCFFPDAQGDWKVVVDDEMGHRLEVNVPVDKAMNLKTDRAAGRSKSSLAKYERALMGVSIILGISGILFWWKGKRIYRKINRGSGEDCT